MSSILHKDEREPTGFLLFSDAYRTQVKTELQLSGKSSKAKKVTRKLLRRWKRLSHFEQLEWNTKAINARFINNPKPLSDEERLQYSAFFLVKFTSSDTESFW